MNTHNDDKKKSTPLLIFLLAFISLLLLVIAVLLVRVNKPQPPGEHPPLPHGPGNRHHPLKTITGRVNGFSHNIHRDVNGIKLATPSKGLLTFEFRPHTASAVASAGNINDSVQADYFTQPNDESITYRLRRIKNLKTGKVIDVDELPPPPRIPLGQQVQTFSLHNPEIVTDPYGGIAALGAENKLFHVKPEQVEDIQALIKKGRVFVIQAVQRGPEQGFLNVDQHDVYIVISITIDNKTFMIR